MGGTKTLDFSFNFNFRTYAIVKNVKEKYFNF